MITGRGVINLSEMERADASEEQVKAGTALYSRFVLSVYDWWFLGFNCRFLWECPPGKLLEHYNRHVSANHLDVGVGTGYFLDKCTLPADNLRLAIVDLNIASLEVASRRLARYHPEVYQRNVLKPFDIKTPRFDSVSMMNLLHCIPGNPESKATVFAHAKELMNPGAVIFGATVLYREVRPNLLAAKVIRYSNRKRYMFNLDDRLEDLREGLRRHFSESSVEVIGCEALFPARK